MKDIHIGSIIRRKLEESQLTIAEFAKRINKTRPTAYDIFNRKSIDIDLLIKISEVLEYNFLLEVYLKEQGGGGEKSKENLPTLPIHRYIVGVQISEQELPQYINNNSTEPLVILKIENHKSVNK